MYLFISSVNRKKSLSLSGSKDEGVGIGQMKRSQTRAALRVGLNRV